MNLSELVNKAIVNKPPDDLRSCIGASSIGYDCYRAIWYGLNGYEKNPHNSRTKINFEVGKQLEKFFMDMIESSGITVIRPNDGNKNLYVQDNELNIFQGHMDGVLIFNTGEECVLEIKTAKNANFMKFKKNGLKSWSSIYYSQLQAYMGMSGISLGVLMAVNKDTSELYHEYISFDQTFYEFLKRKAAIIAEHDTPPAKINKNPCFYLCTGCPYKEICHVD